jgi:hypothetical protein
LGGHSLIAIRILAEVRRRFGVAVPVGAILESGSLEEMAAAIEQAGAEVALSGAERYGDA